MNQDSAAFLRAVKGPVMMITVGVLFALDNFTPFSFSRTWPVLLVVAGILSLGKRGAWNGKFRYQAQWGPPRPPAPPPPPPPPFPFGGPGAASSAPSGASTAPPGTYRGSSYEATPGAAPNNKEAKETRERPSPAPGPGGAQ